MRIARCNELFIDLTLYFSHSPHLLKLMISQIREGMECEKKISHAIEKERVHRLRCIPHERRICSA